MNNTKQHQKLVDDILFAIGSLDYVRLWRRDVGYAEDVNGRHIHYGISGESDLDGVIGPYGIGLSIEIKTGTGKLRENQKRWKKMRETFGCIHIVGRDVDQVKKELEEKLNEWKAKWLLK